MSRRRPPTLLLFFPICGLAALWSRKDSDYGGSAAGKSPIERAIDAANTQDPAKMRAAARKLRAEGHTDLADRLEQAAALFQKMRAQPKAVWPADADPVNEPWLRDEPVPGQEDLMIADWLQRTDNGGPPLTVEDLYPDRKLRRALTPRERWALGPYFPVSADLDGAELRFETPPNWTQQMANDQPVYAVTFGVAGKPVVYFPKGPRSLLSRFWLAVLGHELIHGAQFRVSGGALNTTEDLLRWGYELTPTEVQARFYQRVIYGDLLRRAAAYWEPRGGVPLFPLPL
jgi:hypothetical protein